MIHPTAVIHPHAELGAGTSVGPYAIIDEHVRLGENCQVGPHVHITGHTTIASGNRFHTACVIGDAPQDLKYRDAPTGVAIGRDNVFREHVTVHRSNKPDEPTQVGSNCFLMAASHVGHNSVVGNHVIMANGSMLGGHGWVGDRAFLSGNCMTHQFVRVGTLSLMQGGSGISQDLPPFTIAAWGINRICGLNTIGLRRAGFSSEQRMELRRLYQTLFHGSLNLRAAIKLLLNEPVSDAGRVLLDFITTSKRGVCMPAPVSSAPASLGASPGADNTDAEF